MAKIQKVYTPPERFPGKNRLIVLYKWREARPFGGTLIDDGVDEDVWVKVSSFEVREGVLIISDENGPVAAYPRGDWIRAYFSSRIKEGENDV